MIKQAAIMINPVLHIMSQFTELFVLNNVQNSIKKVFKQHTVIDVLVDFDWNILKHGHIQSLSFLQHHASYRVSSSVNKRKAYISLSSQFSRKITTFTHPFMHNLRINLRKYIYCFLNCLYHIIRIWFGKDNHVIW